MGDGRLLQSVAQHQDLVTAIAASSDGRTVVSGALAPVAPLFRWAHKEPCHAKLG